MTADGARSTYRLQLGPDLDFAAAAELCDYLAALGVTHVYCSPVLQARAGSTHGYDVADPTRVSEALGGEHGLRGLAAAAEAAGLALLVDVVPNHVGAGPDNPLWDALLAGGADAQAASFFDVDWTPPLAAAAGKVLLPILGAPYGDVLQAGELAVVYEAHGPRVRYHDHSLPLSATAREALPATLDELHGTPGDATSWGRLHELLEAQHYRLVHWRVGDAIVNYRRFFAIDELVAVRVEEPHVFEHMHTKVLELVREGLVAGLRLDHIDGLTDPHDYLERLRAAVGADHWIVVEKILAPGEHLPAWPVAGTTGYDFLADVLGLFVDPAGEQRLTATAHDFDAWPGGRLLAPEVHGAKREALERDLAADSERLVDRFWAVTQEHVEARDVTRAACRAALLGVLAELDVYRVYTTPERAATAEEAAWIEAAVQAARARTAEVPGFLWTFLEAFLRGSVQGGPLHAETLRRFHQVASAAMAKGVEDTLLYRQHRLVALNDVGVEPEPFGLSVAAFHSANSLRAARHPQGLLTTSTHDTKRGEDVRLRIAALSEIPDLWAEAVAGWRARNAELVPVIDGMRVPDPATEYLCYQTLVGISPPGGRPDLEDLRERVGAYLVKATREAGLRTSWIDPDDAYEQGLVDFVGRLLDEQRGRDFLAELATVAARTAEIGMASSLSQLLLRVTSPGVPDTYQGMELWRDDLVDPDNRRPVDFAARRRALEALDADPPEPSALLADRADGRVKLWVLSRALRARRAHPACFGLQGSYEPLPIEGTHANRVVAFARVGVDGSAAVTVAPRAVGGVTDQGRQPPVGELWGDTTVRLPDHLAGPWRDALGGPGPDGAAGLGLAAVLSALPVALLVTRDGVTRPPARTR